MTVFYLDTSALVKRYRTEQGTEVVEELLADPSPEDRFFICFLSIIEMTSGVLRLARGSQLREDTANRILARFRLDVRELFRVWPLNEQLAADAVAVAERHKLRAGDAIHLAAAQQIAGAASGTQVVMVSSDRELVDAAQASGLAPLDPQAGDSAAKVKEHKER